MLASTRVYVWANVTFVNFTCPIAVATFEQSNCTAKVYGGNFPVGHMDWDEAASEPIRTEMFPIAGLYVSLKFCMSRPFVMSS